MAHFLSYLHRRFPEWHGQAARQGERSFPIDLVYTWVDGADSRHQEAMEPFGREPLHRTYSSDELYFSLDTVKEFAPWVNRIHIVSADYQAPELSKLDPAVRHKVSLVSHSEIIPREFLPTFNSHVIELYLHRIAGLAEHFIYFNDDFFFGATVTPGDFFAPDGRFFFLFEDRIDYVASYISRFCPGREISFANSIRLYAKAYAKRPWLLFKKPLHQGAPARKAAFDAMHRHPLIQPAIRRASALRLRSRNDPIIPFFLAYLVGLEEGLGCLRRFADSAWLILDDVAASRSKLATVLRRKPKLFCLNNDVADEDQDALKEALREFYRSYFCDPCREAPLGTEY